MSSTYQTYALFNPSTGSPLLGENKLSGIVDPFGKTYNTPEGFFPIDDFSIDIEQSGTPPTGTGSGAGKVHFNPFSITRKIDKASPALFLNTCQGLLFRNIDIVLRRVTGTSGVSYMGYRFGTAILKSMVWSHTADIPTETLTFEYTTMYLDYTPQNADGSLGTGILVGWDSTKNTKA